ncbi:HD domain-containing protein [Catellatospora paridis]|uniref:HD domain-containing protein n=1 Tax=Catellatospora paridis TaxID=1617086 RepID=UPI0012D4AFAF|nr:HD domain-containing protein [Catellatospora paridis]
MSIELSATPAAQAAVDIATRYCSPALLNHSIRAYLWGASYAAAHGIGFDEELYFVSAMLHDLGLTTPFDSHTMPFEEAGGDLGWMFGTAAGWSPERRARIDEIIVRHMRDDVSADEDAESHLLQVSTSWDVVGRHATEFPAALRTEVLAAYPRLGFGAEFLELFNDQAARKPRSAAAAAVNSGMASRVEANPLDT